MKITITYEEKTQKTIDIDLPVFIDCGYCVCKIISDEEIIQASIEGNATEETGVRKWKNKQTVTRLLTAGQFPTCDEQKFKDAYQNALTALAAYVDEGNI